MLGHQLAQQVLLAVLLVRPLGSRRRRLADAPAGWPLRALVGTRSHLQDLINSCLLLSDLERVLQDMDALLQRWEILHPRRTEVWLDPPLVVLSTAYLPDQACRQGLLGSRAHLLLELRAALLQLLFDLANLLHPLAEVVSQQVLDLELPPPQLLISRQAIV